MRQNPDGTAFLGRLPHGYADARMWDPSGIDGIPSDLREDAKAFAVSIAPYLEEAAIVNEELGIRSLTPDGAPIIGRTGVENLSIAVFSANRIQLSPAAGKLFARYLRYGESLSAYDAISSGRFSKSSD